MSAGYQEIRLYSVVLGCEASRLSMFDHNGSEFFIMLPVRQGREWREMEQRAAEKIADAIDRKELPGEVEFP